VTYFRGGSTFLGEVFNQNEDVFYWYEPYAELYDRMVRDAGMPNDASGSELFSHADDKTRCDTIRDYPES
jgi:hypothetical protein